ncbi:hypothetical protein [Allocoleopsis sp.]|uniref:hypothetical protein n=1 Tax=Allocoleopsis sp. TaxID=3088169 RepID=UPI002FD2D2A8
MTVPLCIYLSDILLYRIEGIALPKRFNPRFRNVCPRDMRSHFPFSEAIAKRVKRSADRILWVKAQHYKITHEGTVKPL